MFPILFAHGLESSPQGTKASLLAQRFGALAVDLRAFPLRDQIALLVTELRRATQTVLVGSSLGGLAALGAARIEPGRIAHLVLFAPAVGAERHATLFEDAERKRPGLRAEVAACATWAIPKGVPATVLHGLEDEVIATADVVALVERSPSCRLVLVHDSHQLGEHLELICALVGRASNGQDLLAQG